jgi:hypothetical protein
LISKLWVDKPEPHARSRDIIVRKNDVNDVISVSAGRRWVALVAGVSWLNHLLCSIGSSRWYIYLYSLCSLTINNVLLWP